MCVTQYFQAAEQPQADLGSTINALVSATPPNVALKRTDFHHLYHHTSMYLFSATYFYLQQYVFFL